MCIVIGGFYFLISMVVLIANEQFLEFGLKSGYESFYSRATELLDLRGINYAPRAPISELMFRFWLAVWSGVIAIFFTFPGLRYSQASYRTPSLRATRLCCGRVEQIHPI